MALLKTLNLNKTPWIYIPVKYYGKYTTKHKNYRKFYNILGVCEESTEEQIKSAYIELAKKYHPDSGTEDASSNKFREIDEAFRALINKRSQERIDKWNANEKQERAQEFDIKHTAPQHRQYLSYEGAGSGTIFQREKQYRKMRTVHAAESVLSHRMNKEYFDEKSLITKNPLKHDVKTKYGYDRLVEDLIQEAMSKGQFDNLKHSGKPLNTNRHANPYVDFVTHKMNEILMDNGFTPEWIMLQKEIREDKDIVEKNLHQERELLGPYPFSDIDAYKWEKAVEKYMNMAKDINKKIEKFNLVVPILQKQMFLYSMEKVAEKIAETGRTKKEARAASDPRGILEVRENPKNIFSFFETFFYKTKGS